MIRHTLLPFARRAALAGAAALAALLPLPAAAEVENPLLWRIDREPPAFLFGTIHLPDERLNIPGPTVMAAFEEADAFYGELAMTPMTMGIMAGAAMSLFGPTLEQQLGPEDWARVEAIFARRGLSAQQLQQMKPWAAAAQLGLLDYMEQMATVPIMDIWLYQQAVEAGMETGGLETVQEQIGVFESMSREEQLEFLRKAIADVEEADLGEAESPIEILVQAYLRGDTQAMLDYLDAEYDPEDEVQARFMRMLLTDRDIRMAQRIDEKLRANPDRSYFFAVGAMHLSGRDCIRRLLEAKGWEIERVEASAPAAAY